MKKLYVDKSNIIGKGLFTHKSFKKNDFISYIDGPIFVIRKYTPNLSKETLNWIGVGRFSWINTDASQYRFINHSCDPNAAQITNRKVIAIKDIPADTELTIDYSLTESEEDWKIENCTCGTASCRKKIQAIMKLPKGVFNQKKRYIPKKFQSIYLSANK